MENRTELMFRDLANGSTFCFQRMGGEGDVYRKEGARLASRVDGSAPIIPMVATDIVFATGDNVPLEMRAAPDDHEFIVIGPWCWGRGVLAKVAYNNARKNLPRTTIGDGSRKVSFSVYLCSLGCSVTDMGGIMVPRDGTCEYVGDIVKIVKR